MDSLGERTWRSRCHTFYPSLSKGRKGLSLNHKKVKDISVNDIINDLKSSKKSKGNVDVKDWLPNKLKYATNECNFPRKYSGLLSGRCNYFSIRCNYFTNESKGEEWIQKVS
jgi:hypothetical protein